MAMPKHYVSPFATAKPAERQPGKPALEGPKTPPSKPADSKRAPAKDKHTDVTVKLPGPLLAKLDRLVKRESGRLGKAGRSTVLRWLLDQYSE